MSDYADKEQDDPVENIPEAKRKKGSGSRKFKFQYDFEDGLPDEQQELSNNTSDPDHQIQRKAFNDQRPQQQNSLQLKTMVNQSPQAQQALQFKAMVDRSSQAQQALQLKERLDNSPHTQEALRTQQMIHNSPRAVAQRNYLGQFTGNPREKKEQQFPSRPVQMKAKTWSFPGSAEQPKDNTQVQFDGSTSTMDTQSIHKTAQKGVEGKGGKLPHLGKIQKSFGKHNVTQAQAYTGPKAASAAKSMGAEAYTTRNKVAFARSNPSLHTTAHEAAHLVQQGSGIKLKGGVGQKGDPYERHADAVADRVVQGKSAESLLNQFSHPGGVQQKPASGSPLQNQEGGNIYTDKVTPIQYKPQHHNTGEPIVQMLNTKMKSLNKLMLAGVVPNNQVALNYPGHVPALPAGNKIGAAGGAANITTAGEQYDNTAVSAPGTPQNMAHYNNSNHKWSRNGGLVRDRTRNQASTKMHALNHKLDPLAFNIVANNIFLGTAKSNNRHRSRVERHVEKTFRGMNAPATRENTAYEAAMAAATVTTDRTSGNGMLYWSNTNYNVAWTNTAIDATELKIAAANNTNYGAGVALNLGATLMTDNEAGKAIFTNNAPANNYYHAWVDYTVTPNYTGVPAHVGGNITHEMTQLGIVGNNPMKLITAATGGSALKNIAQMDVNDAKAAIINLPNNNHRAAVLGNTNAPQASATALALIGAHAANATAVLILLPLATMAGILGGTPLQADRATIVNTIAANGSADYAADLLAHLRGIHAGNTATLVGNMITNSAANATAAMILLPLADITAILNAVGTGANKALLVNTLAGNGSADYAADLLAHLRGIHAGNTATLVGNMITNSTVNATAAMILLPLADITAILNAVGTGANKALLVNTLAGNGSADYAADLLAHLRGIHAGNTATLVGNMITNSTVNATAAMILLPLADITAILNAVGTGANKALLVNTLAGNGSADYAADLLAHLRGIHAGNTATLVGNMITNSTANATAAIILLPLADATAILNAIGTGANKARFINTLSANGSADYAADLIAHLAGIHTGNTANLLRAMVTNNAGDAAAVMVLLPLADLTPVIDTLNAANGAALLDALAANGSAGYAADLVNSWANTDETHTANALIATQAANTAQIAVLIPTDDLFFIIDQLNNTNKGLFMNRLVANGGSNYAADLVGAIHTNDARNLIVQSNNASRVAIVTRLPRVDLLPIFASLGNTGNRATLIHILAANGGLNYAIEFMAGLINSSAAPANTIFQALPGVTRTNLYNGFTATIRGLLTALHAFVLPAHPGPAAFALPNVIPNALPGAAPNNAPGAAPNNLPGATPNNLPAAAPNNLPAATPNNLPASTPNNLPAVAPNNLPTGGTIPGANPNLAVNQGTTAYRLEKLATFQTWKEFAFPANFTADVRFYAATYDPAGQYDEYIQNDTYDTDA